MLGSRGGLALTNLIVAIDMSEDGSRVIAVVGAREHVIKISRFDRLLQKAKARQRGRI